MSPVQDVTAPARRTAFATLSRKLSPGEVELAVAMLKSGLSVVGVVGVIGSDRETPLKEARTRASAARWLKTKAANKSRKAGGE